MGESDEWLMRQVAAGESHCLEPLIRRYGSALLTFITRMDHSFHGAEDIFQEVFLAVWSHRGTYRYPHFFRPWLYQIALNKCREAHRRVPLKLADRPVEDLAHEVLAQARCGESPVETVTAVETSALVETAVARLPEKQRAVLVLRIWGGLGYVEIAETVGSRESTVRSRMHDALINLRRQLEPHMNPSPGKGTLP